MEGVWLDNEWDDVSGMSITHESCNTADSLVWCKAMKDYVTTLTARHGAIYAQRIDIYYPGEADSESIHPGNRDFTKFVNLLDNAIRRKEYAFGCKRIGHLAVREFGDVAKKKHYHVIIFFKASEMVLDNKRHYQNSVLNQMLGDKWEVVSGGRGVYYHKSVIIEKGGSLPAHWVEYLTKPNGKRRDGYSNLLKSNERIITSKKHFLNESAEKIKSSAMMRKMNAKKSKTLLISGTLHLPLNAIRMIEKSEVVQFLKELNSRLYDAGRGYLSGGVVALQHTPERGLASFTVGLDGHKNGWSQVRDFIAHRVHDIMLQSWYTVTGKGTMLVDNIHLVKPRDKNEEERSKARTITKKLVNGMFEVGKKTVGLVARFFGPKKKNGQKK